MHVHSAVTGAAVRNWFGDEADGSIAYDVLRGLTAPQKYIPSKYFYDARGSELFEAICRLPEYYPTRTELQVLTSDAKEIVRGFRRGDLVELGSGANWKIRKLLDALEPHDRSSVRYVPVDVSHSALLESAQDLMAAYPELKVSFIVADFTRDLHRIQSDRPKLLLFFGSTIGNLDERESSSFLRGVAGILNPDDRFVLGLDMLKPVHIIEAAYNDSRNVTAEFNKNILLVINRELGANFRPDDFDHVAFFDEKYRRVEMHLRARRNIWVEISEIDLIVVLKKGETIRTEICRKFSRAGAQEMIREAGMAVSGWYSDPKGWFSIAEIVLERS